MPGFRDRDPITKTLGRVTAGKAGRAALAAVLAAGIAEVGTACSSTPTATPGGLAEFQGSAAGDARAVILNPPAGATVSAPQATASSSEWQWTVSVPAPDKRSGTTAQTGLYCFEATAATKVAADINADVIKEFSAWVVDGNSCTQTGEIPLGIQILGEDPGFKGWEVKDTSGSVASTIGDPTAAARYVDAAGKLVANAQAGVTISDAMINAVTAIEQNGTAAPQSQG